MRTTKNVSFSMMATQVGDLMLEKKGDDEIAFTQQFSGVIDSSTVGELLGDDDAMAALTQLCFDDLGELRDIGLGAFPIKAVFYDQLIKITVSRKKADLQGSLQAFRLSPLAGTPLGLEDGAQFRCQFKMKAEAEDKQLQLMKAAMLRGDCKLEISPAPGFTDSQTEIPAAGDDEEFE